MKMGEIWHSTFWIVAIYSELLDHFYIFLKFLPRAYTRELLQVSVLNFISGNVHTVVPSYSVVGFAKTSSQTFIENWCFVIVVVIVVIVVVIVVVVDIVVVVVVVVERERGRERGREGRRAAEGIRT